MIRTTDVHGLPAIELRAPDGASATVTLHGAHLVSWRAVPAPGRAAEEQLFLSERAQFSDGHPIRGGVPVVFPQFADRGPLPKHGLVRTRAWRLQHSESRGGEVLARFALGDDDATRALWPHAFTLTFDLRLGGPVLAMTLGAFNPGPAAMAFTAALHTYLRVDQLDAVRVRGLEGRPYWDKVLNLDTRQGPEALAIRGEVDRVYASAPSALELCDGARTLALTQQGFGDSVVWNPGPTLAAALPDLAPDEYRRMLCIEAAQVERPVALEPGAHWAGTQRLLLR